MAPLAIVPGGLFILGDLVGASRLTHNVGSELSAPHATHSRMANPERIKAAAADMAEVIKEALFDYGQDFDRADLFEIAGSALARIPVSDLSTVIVSRLLDYGHDRCDAVTGPDDNHDPADVATFARISWAEVIQDVDAGLPDLRGKRRPHPLNLVTRDGSICACDCGCNDNGGAQ